MEIKTSIKLNLPLRDEVKLIYGVYGVKSLSAFINGFFYYLVHQENPANGGDIEGCIRDALSGKILKTQNPFLLAEAKEAKAVTSYLNESYGRAFLVVLRRFGVKKYLQNHTFIHRCCEEVYESSGIVVLEDKMQKYLADWYYAAKRQPEFKEVELEVLKTGGLVLIDKGNEKTTEEGAMED